MFQRIHLPQGGVRDWNAIARFYDDGLALEMTSRQLEIELRQRLGETELPAAIEPRNQVVL